jgi:hypothetical protein
MPTPRHGKVAIPNLTREVWKGKREVRDLGDEVADLELDR